MTRPPIAIVTRPIERFAETAARLKALGFDATAAPALEIHHETDARIDLSGAQALAFTSSAGVDAFARASDARTLPVYAVGEATARAARDAGFADVSSADGDVGDLAALITSSIDGARGAVLHARGRHAAGDLAETLRDAGFNARESVLYRAEPARALPDDARRVLSDEARERIVLLFSPRSATAFVQLIEDAGLTEPAHGATAACLSEAVAKAAQAGAWREIRTAAAPTLDALLDTLVKAEN